MNDPQHPPTSLLHAPTHAITKYKHPAGSIHTLATTPQSHLLPLGFPSLISSPPPTLLVAFDFNRSGIADAAIALSPEYDLDDGSKLLVTHIWMLRETHVVVPMRVQQRSGRTVVQRRSALSRILRWPESSEGFVPRFPRISKVKWVAGQHMACSARRRMSVDRGG